MKSLKKVVLLVLIAVMILSFAACGKKADDPVILPATDNTKDYVQVFENGATEFEFKTVDLEGNEKLYLVKTDKENVGDALLETKLIEGEVGSYGLFVTAVEGISLDWNKDQAYWAFYIGDEYAMTGVDATPVEAGKLYTFKAEKAA